MLDPSSEMPRPPKPDSGKFELTNADHDLLDYEEGEKEEKMDEDKLCKAEEDLEAENESAETENKELSI